jgi:hypothetical protein
MGQFINIDKEEKLDEVFGKWTELQWVINQQKIHVLALGNPWAGDRIMVIGRDAHYFPPGILTEEEKDYLDGYECMQFRDALRRGSVKLELLRGENAIVLRNLSSREYITNRLFSCKLAFPHVLPQVSTLILRVSSPPTTSPKVVPDSDDRHPDLSQALVSKISWSSSGSLGIPWHPNWHWGSWAGARIDFTLFSNIEKPEEWKDITEATFRDLWKAFSISGILNPECKCNLCEIYRQMCPEEEEKKDQAGKKSKANSKHVWFISFYGY